MKKRERFLKFNLSVMFLGLFILSSANAYATEWVSISGTVYYNGQPMCVMVLANGQYMFTDATDGRYDMNVPLDINGEITLFAFCDGLAPYKTVLKLWEVSYYNINMSAASAGSQSMNISVTQQVGWGEPVARRLG